MLHRVTVVLHQNRGLALQLRHQRLVDSRPPKGRFERLSRQSKLVRRAIVRSSQHHKGAIAAGLESAIDTLPGNFAIACSGLACGAAIPIIPSCVEEAAPPPRYLSHHLSQRIDVCGVRLPRMRGLPHRTLRKGRMTALLEPCVGLGRIIFQRRH
jgi:hypothetical protein